ncbi:AAA family ATPase [Actinomadura kijaniata]|uniref:AAA family ATPase n=1 Tax=Actinomadura kijaniata TaxID=46161 RepID=UPI000AC87585|nr:AAA family ATPase [Actinomadura kijaniata]
MTDPTTPHRPDGHTARLTQVWPPVRPAPADTAGPVAPPGPGPARATGEAASADQVPDPSADPAAGRDQDHATDPTADQGGTRLLLTPASTVQMRAVRWLWDQRVPAGAISVLPGREGIGKSLLLAWLTARITRGQLPGLHYGTPRPVIYAASEDSWAYTIAPRLHAAGADLDLVYRVDVERDGVIDSLTLPRDTAALAAEITARGVVLLAADPLLSLIHSRIDTHRDRELRTALEPLARLADVTGCAVVGLAHFNKSANGDALNLITGSRAFSAVARAVLAVARDPDADDGSCVLSQAKSNLGRLDLPSLRYQIVSATVPTADGDTSVGVLEFTGESARGVADILADAAGDPSEHSERREAADWLRDYLISQGGETVFTDLLKAARAEGFSERTLRRARSRAAVVSTREGFPAKTVWRLSVNDTASPASPVRPQSGQCGQGPGVGRTGRTVAGLTDAPHSPQPDDAHQTPLSDHSQGVHP